MNETRKAIVGQLRDAARRLDALLRSEEPSRVLAQLRQREADGVPLAAIDHAALRSGLEGEIASHPFALAATKLAEAIELIEALPARSSNQAAVDATSPAPTTAGDAAAVPDDLTLVRGIDTADAGCLAGHGITRFAELAGLTAAAVRQLVADPAIGSAIYRDGWIEQAAVLAAGRVTRFAERRLRSRGEASSLATGARTPPIEPQALPPPAAPPAAHAPLEPIPPLPLTLIRGIDRGTAARLGRLGITGTPQIAAWTAADAARVRALLGLDDRIAREGWIEQAAILARGQLTEHARLCSGPPPLVARPEPPPLPIAPPAPHRQEPRVPLPPRLDGQQSAAAGEPPAEPAPLRPREGSLLAMLAEIEAAVALTVAIAEGMQANEPRRPPGQDAPVPARSQSHEDVEVLIRPRAEMAAPRPSDRPIAAAPVRTPQQAVDALVIGDNGEEASFEIRSGGASTAPLRRTRLQELREAEAERRLTDEKGRAIKRLMTALRGPEKPH